MSLNKNIFISSFCANPNFGSEFAVGWNIPFEIAKNSKHNVYLFIGTFEGKGFGNFRGLQNIEIPKNLFIIPVHPNKLVRLLNLINSKFSLGIFFYFALRFWGKLVLKKATSVAKYAPPDITHQLNPIGFREPGFLFKLNAFHFWGPIGGYVLLPTRSYKKTNIYFFKSIIKNLVNIKQARSIRVSNAFKSSSKIIFATEDNYYNFNKHYDFDEKIIISESALHKKDLNVKSSSARQISDQLQCLFVGSLNYRKNIIFLIDLFERLCPKSFQLKIIGSGKLDSTLKKMVKHKKMSNVIFLGQVPYNKVKFYYKSSDILLLPSYAEGNPNVLWESFSQNLPVMSFDRNGMSTTLLNRGFLIKSKTYKEDLNSWKFSLESIKNDISILNKIKDNISKDINKDTWSSRAKQFIELYEKVK